jgi:hypothetical protein
VAVVDHTQFSALYHGTKAQLNLGELIGRGYASIEE